MSLVLKWKSKNDLLTCPTCRKLHGYTWTFNASKGDVMPKDLCHPVYGKVIDGESDLSVVCKDCRCEVVADVDWADTIKLAKEVLAELKEKEKRLLKAKRENNSDRLLGEWDEEWGEDGF